MLNKKKAFPAKLGMEKMSQNVVMDRKGGQMVSEHLK